jgi:protein gp37
MTEIAWTEETWNPLAGCTKISAGCANCYAAGHALRLAGNPNPQIRARYAGLAAATAAGANWTGTITLAEDRLHIPLHWKKPRMIFVNSMSDLFHTDVPLDFIKKVFATIEKAPQHTFQILTKRAGRLAELAPVRCWHSNIWMGVTVESADVLDRVDHLRQVPAGVRWLSCEPLLGPLAGLDLTGIDWLVVGGESGPRARQMDPAWAQDLVHRCQAAGVAVFMKQIGTAWANKTGAVHSKGGDPAEWPMDLRVLEYPAAA